MIDAPRDEPALEVTIIPGGEIYVRAKCDKCERFANFALPESARDAWVKYGRVVKILRQFNENTITSADDALLKIAEACE